MSSRRKSPPNLKAALWASAEAAAGAMSSKFGIVERGRENTEDYRVFFQDHAGNVVSPFHDIPLR